MIEEIYLRIYLKFKALFYSLSPLLLRYHSQYWFIFIIRINYYETDNWSFKILETAKDFTNDSSIEDFLIFRFRNSSLFLLVLVEPILQFKFSISK